MAKYKATGCTRFLLFILIFAPIAYFGSQYLMNSGKWDDIRSKVENVSNDKNSVERAIESKEQSTTNSQVQKKLEQLLDKIDEQEKIIGTQEEMLKKQNALIEQLKQQLQSNTSKVQVEQPVPSSNGTSLEELLKEADKALKKN